MRKLVFPTLAVALLLLSAVPAAEASWSFYGYDYGTEAWCFGEPRTGFDASCHIETSPTTSVSTTVYQGKCAASVRCGFFVKTCLASDTYTGGNPWDEPACYAVSYASAPASSRAVCKSDLGTYLLRCD